MSASSEQPLSLCVCRPPPLVYWLAAEEFINKVAYRPKHAETKRFDDVSTRLKRRRQVL